MRQAANLKGLSLPMLVPGITINTSPTEFTPLRHMRLIRFDGTAWTLFGPVVGD
jgi:branched-chain amino acid transport system substrate-binding protein